MSDTLIGVIIGGLIGSLAPLATLFFSHLHWRREAKLDYLKAERSRLEQLSEKNLTRFAEVIAEKRYSLEMSADFAVLMPKEVLEFYLKFMTEEDHSEDRCRKAYLELAILMKRALSDIDKQINDLVS